MKNKFLKKIKIAFHLSLIIFIISLFISNIVLAQNCAQGYEMNGQGECVPIIPIDDDNSNPGTQTEQGDPINNDNNPQNTDTPNEVILTPDNGADYKKGYQLLAPLDGFTSFDTTQPCAFGVYLDIMIKLFIGICAVLAVIIIVMGGIEYMTSELVSSKEHGKGQITQAVFGLILALGAWLILNQLNPNLLELCLDVPDATPIAIEGDENSIPFATLTSTAQGKFDVYCPGSGGVDEIEKIAQSFAGKVTYSQSKRGTYDGSSIYLDCSSFVAQVYECAGLDLPGDPTTLGMLTGQEDITNISGTKVNGEELQPGDVLGWMKGESRKFPRAGHVVLYLGGGSFIEVSGGGGAKNAVHIRPLSHYLNEFRHIIRVNFT